MVILNPWEICLSPSLPGWYWCLFLIYLSADLSRPPLLAVHPAGSSCLSWSSCFCWHHAHFSLCWTTRKTTFLLHFRILRACMALCMPHQPTQPQSSTYSILCRLKKPVVSSSSYEIKFILGPRREFINPNYNYSHSTIESYNQCSPS